MDEKQVEQQIGEYADLAKQNQNIDVASLMLSAMNQQNSNVVSGKAKKWAYLISIGVPPFGLLFALKYFTFSDEDDAKTVAIICTVLTILSIALFWFIGSAMLSGSGTSLDQIQQITPQEIHNTLQ